MGLRRPVIHVIASGMKNLVAMWIKRRRLSCNKVDHFHQSLTCSCRQNIVMHSQKLPLDLGFLLKLFSKNSRFRWKSWHRHLIYCGQFFYFVGRKSHSWLNDSRAMRSNRHRLRQSTLIIPWAFALNCRNGQEIDGEPRSPWCCVVRLLSLLLSTCIFRCLNAPKTGFHSTSTHACQRSFVKIVISRSAFLFYVGCFFRRACPVCWGTVLRECPSISTPIWPWARRRSGDSQRLTASTANRGYKPRTSAKTWGTRNDDPQAFRRSISQEKPSTLCSYPGLKRKVASGNKNWTKTECFSWRSCRATRTQADGLFFNRYCSN